MPDNKMPDKIIISGGTGLIGSHLAEKFKDKGCEIFLLTRSPEKHSSSSEQIKFIKWDQNEANESYKDLFEDAKVVINLAGASVGDKRWTESFKKVLYDSRIKTTRKLVDIINLCGNPPECLLSASGTGAYYNGGDNVITEDSPLGNDFLANLCKDWESEARKAEAKGVRVIISRNGVVLDKDDGALPQLVRPFKFFVGGYLGKGDQWFPWIHIKDMINLTIWAIESELSGVINNTSPNPETNKNFSKKLAKAIHRPCIFGIPAFVLKIVLGEFAETLLVSQRVVPQRALDNGFTFEFDTLDKALANLLTQ